MIIMKLSLIIMMNDDDNKVVGVVVDHWFNVIIQFTYNGWVSPVEWRGVVCGSQSPFCSMPIIIMALLWLYYWIKTTRQNHRTRTKNNINRILLIILIVVVVVVMVLIIMKMTMIIITLVNWRRRRPFHRPTVTAIFFDNTTHYKITGHPTPTQTDMRRQRLSQQH